MNNTLQMTTPVCLITGVGEATGASIAERFSRAGYRVAMVARNAVRGFRLEADIPGAQAYPCDIGELDALTDCMASVRNDLGNPSVVIHNAVSATFDRFLDGNPEDLERNFRVNTTALLYLARGFAPLEQPGPLSLRRGVCGLWADVARGSGTNTGRAGTNLRRAA